MADTRMKPGPFQQLLDEARRWGIDTTGYDNSRGSVERLRARIAAKESAGTRPSMTATTRRITMDDIPAFRFTDIEAEQMARAAGVHLMRLVDWKLGGSSENAEPDTPDVIKDATVLVTSIEQAASHVVAVLDQRAARSRQRQ